MKRVLVPSVIVALVAMGVVVIVLRPWLSESATDKDRKLDSGAATNLARDEEVQALIQQREQLDRTVWADEIQAQQHEMVFVRLWDALRDAPDAYAVARTFQCPRIVLGVPEAYEDLGADVEIARTGPDSIRLDGSTWLDWLSEQESAGYHLAQCEWHHEAFHPASAGEPARSTVAMVLHVDNQRDGRRWQIEGHLEVEWGDVRTPSDYQIRHIDMGIAEEADCLHVASRISIVMDGPIF